MTLRLWDLKTGKAVLVLRNQHEVGTVAFSPDGTLLAFGVWNEGIQVWALNEVLPPAPAASASGLIAFLSDRDGEPAIYVMNADGSNQRRLAGGKPKDTCLRPVWSPDGLQIAFFSRRDGNVEICLMDAAGGNLQRLTEQVGDDSFPSWSPDGSQIIFSSVRDGNDEIYVMNSDGSNTHPLTDNGAQNWSPVWRPLP
jgi:Tol biopolymer transport system component